MFRHNPETGLNDHHSYRPQRNLYKTNKWETIKNFHHRDEKMIEEKIIGKEENTFILGINTYR